MRFALPAFILPLLATAALTLSGCGRGDPSSSEGASGDLPENYRIVATTGMVGAIAEAVAGPVADVEVLIRPGTDPHLYQPTRTDLNELAAADVILYNGMQLEGKMTDVLVKLARQDKLVLAVSEAIQERSDYLIEEQDGALDPHIWMDVAGWSTAVGVVAEALAEADPEHGDGYLERAVAFEEKLDALDAYAERVLGTIPKAQRILVTAHDAFGYLGRAYDLEVRGIQGLSTESEAGLRDIEELVDLLVERKIPAVFVETSVSDRNVKALLEGAADRGHEVRIGGELFSDAMGPAGTYEGTYIGMIDHNVTTIARALGGSAPVGGMQGKLAQ